MHKIALQHMAVTTVFGEIFDVICNRAHATNQIVMPLV